MAKPLRMLLSLLLLLAWLPAFAAGAGGAPVEGVDYVTIADGRPYLPLQGKVEVVEVFGYWCPHCAEFQPALSAWEHRLPANVRFTYVPAVFSAGDAYARAYFALVHAGALSRLHDDVFAAIHTDQTLPHDATVDEIAGWLGQHGLDARAMKAYMLGPVADAQLDAARQFALRSGVEGTPTLIVNGRYRIIAATHADGLRIADQLIARLSVGTHPRPSQS